MILHNLCSTSCLSIIYILATETTPVNGLIINGLLFEHWLCFECGVHGRKPQNPQSCI